MNIEECVYYLCESESDVIFMYEKAKELKNIEILKLKDYIKHFGDCDKYYLFIENSYDELLLDGCSKIINKTYKIVDVKVLRRKYKLDSLCY